MESCSRSPFCVLDCGEETCLSAGAETSVELRSLLPFLSKRDMKPPPVPLLVCGLAPPLTCPSGEANGVMRGNEGCDCVNCCVSGSCRGLLECVDVCTGGCSCSEPGGVGYGVAPASSILAFIGSGDELVTRIAGVAVEIEYACLGGWLLSSA